MQFVQARNYHAGRTSPIRLVVIHDMEYPEKPDGAEWCAQYFAGRGAPQASAHYYVDNDSIIQGVREQDTAWAAPGANSDGIQIEHAGFASQSRSQWLDDYSAAELERSAALVAEICARHDIPARHLTSQQLAAGAAGLVGHRDVNAVYHRSDHSDPGPNFPWDVYLGWITGQPPTAPASGRFLTVDGDLGPGTIRVAERVLGTPVDGVTSTPSRWVSAWQVLIHAPGRADGVFGPRSARASEAFLGLPATTVPGWYPALVRGFQRWLNEQIKKGK